MTTQEKLKAIRWDGYWFPPERKGYKTRNKHKKRKKSDLENEINAWYASHTASVQ